MVKRKVCIVDMKEKTRGGIWKSPGQKQKVNMASRLGLVMREESKGGRVLAAGKAGRWRDEGRDPRQHTAKIAG